MKAEIEKKAPASVGAHLHQARRARNLSLADVAEATSISASFLSLVENDKSDITIGRLVRLIEFYGISIADLLPGRGLDRLPGRGHAGTSADCCTRRPRASTSICSRRTRATR